MKKEDSWHLLSTQLSYKVTLSSNQHTTNFNLSLSYWSKISRLWCWWKKFSVEMIEDGEGWRFNIILSGLSSYLCSFPINHNIVELHCAFEEPIGKRFCSAMSTFYFPWENYLMKPDVDFFLILFHHYTYVLFQLAIRLRGLWCLRRANRQTILLCYVDFLFSMRKILNAA